MQGPATIPAEEQKDRRSALPTKKRKSIYDTVNDTEMVEKVFGFLPSMIGGQEGQAPECFEVRQPQVGAEPSAPGAGAQGAAR